MKVFIGVDPHKLSAIIEVVDKNETVLATGRPVRHGQRRVPGDAQTGRGLAGADLGG